MREEPRSWAGSEAALAPAQCPPPPCPGLPCYPPPPTHLIPLPVVIAWTSRTGGCQGLACVLCTGDIK